MRARSAPVNCFIYDPHHSAVVDLAVLAVYRRQMRVYQRQRGRRAHGDDADVCYFRSLCTLIDGCTSEVRAPQPRRRRYRELVPQDHRAGDYRAPHCAQILRRQRIETACSITLSGRWRCPRICVQSAFAPR